MASVAFSWHHHFARQPGEHRRQRLCAMLREAINQGRLQQGDRLPSSRLMAADLALSRVTVEAAYGQLESEGYLFRQTGRGTFVAFSVTKKAQRQQLALPVKLSRRGNQILATGGCQDPLFPHAFAAGSPELRAFPQRIWQRLTSTQQRQQGMTLQRYGDPQGYLPLREAIADYLVQSRGVRCSAQQVVVLTSSQQALQLLAWLLIDPDDEAWLEEPGYPGARNALLSAGANLHPVMLDGEGAQLREGQPKLIYLTPSHHYPGGVTLSLQRRHAWLAFARQQRSWIVEDDYDSEFHYQGEPMPAMQGLDRTGRVIYLGTFSKSLFPSLRLAYMVVPDGLVDALCAARSLMDGHSALLPQAVTAAFISAGHFGAHLRLMRQLYHSRRDLLRQQLEQKLAESLVSFPTQGGMQLPVRLLYGDEAVITRTARQQGLLLPQLSSLYRHGNAVPGWLLGFSALENQEIIQAVDKLARIMESSH